MFFHLKSPFLKSSECSQWIQHSMNVGIDLRVKLGPCSIYLCSVECELAHGMIKSIVLKLNYYGLWS